MLKRPRPGEDEADLLRMQEEFLHEKNRNGSLEPAAEVINLRNSQAGFSGQSSLHLKDNVRKPSKYALSKGLHNQSEKRIRSDQAAPTALVGDILEKSTPNPSTVDDQVYYPQVYPSILGDIVEKNSDLCSELPLQQMPLKGFPVVPRRDSQHARDLHTTFMDIDHASTSIVQDSDTLNIPHKSYLLSSTEAESIHQDNVNKLKSMSEKAILEEKQKLLSTLDPNIVEFLRQRRSKEQVSHSCPIVQQATTQPANSVIENTTEHDTLWENDVLTHPQVGKWLHFNQLEKDKLEWIKGIQTSTQDNPEGPYEARFDFKGYLLPYTLEYTEQTKTLFHHGEEPHRPGYSLSELFELSRSSVTQQRVVALNTLAGLLDYWSLGTYKDIIDIPLSKMLFIIRIAIDENKVIILEAALRALNNLVYNRIDEASLDAWLGFELGLQQPCLQNDKAEIQQLDSHESEMKDFHLAEIDIITALVRTDIIQRIYYILDVIKPPFSSVQYALQILIRLARDSMETVKKIIEAEHLMTSILHQFIPVTSINFSFQPDNVYHGKPFLTALKFLRVLSLQSKEINEILVSKYNILKPVSEYINSGVDSTYGLRIQIESFCILTNLLQFGIGVDHAFALSPVVVTALFKHIQGTDIFVKSSVLSATHAAVVLQFVSELLKNSKHMKIRSLKQQIYPLLEEGIQKWLSQLSQSAEYSCAHLRLASSALDCWKTIMILERVSPKLLNEMLFLLSKSDNLKNMASQMQTCSNILSRIEIKDLNLTKNLVSLGSSVVDSNQKILPVLNASSPFPFLASLIKLLIMLTDIPLSGRFMKLFSPYLKRIDKTTPSLCENWFTRAEVEFLVNTVKLSSQMDLSEPEKDLLYTVSSKLCYILRADNKYELEYLFDNVIFNRNWFTAERLLNLVSFTDTEGVSNVFNSIDEIKSCFSKVTHLNYVNNETNNLLKSWQEPVLPRDWIYLPILHLYSQSQEPEISPKIIGEHASKVAAATALEKELIIKCNLAWILFYELCFSDLLEDISVTDRFCRIMCVYLCDSSIFLDKSVNILLQKILKILFKKKDSLNFDKELVGLNNFQDLYTQFVEQFQGVSYGEATFAACVLAPLAQRHSPRWRRLLWSEYAGALRALDCPRELLCGEPRDYLEPPEADESLVRSYARALAAGLLRPGSLAHTIAAHHVAEYRRLHHGETPPSSSSK